MNKFIYLNLILLSLVTANRQALGDQPEFFEDTLQPVYGDVIFSNIIFRHGDRNTIYSYPNDPYKEHPVNDGVGQLVKTGKQRAYRLGVWARARYAKLIETKPYTPSYVEVASSDVERTIQSAQLFLAGFYPPKFDQEVWNDTFPWQPIAVRQIPKSQDNLIALETDCPRYNVEVVRLQESSEIKEFYERYGRKFFSDVEEHTGIGIPRDNAVLAIINLSGLYDTLFVQEQLGLNHSDWVKSVYPEPLLSIQKKYFRMLVFNDVTKRLKGGTLIKYITQTMLKKRYNATTEAFQVFSGHDTTLSTLLNTLDVYDDTPPPYSAAVFVELRYKDGNYFVTVMYRKSEEKPPLLLELPNCKYPCTLDTFIQATSPLVPKDWREECKSFQPDYNKLFF